MKPLPHAACMLVGLVLAVLPARALAGTAAAGREAREVPDQRSALIALGP